MKPSQNSVPELLDEVYRRDSRQVYATLVRILGDFDLAEDAMHDAFKAALEQWGEKGIPSNPTAWLISTGRFKAIDRMRRQSRFDPLKEGPHVVADPDAVDPSKIDRQIEDDMLRLIFTCCHPALSPEARIAMTLREVCGLTTEEIAHAFLIKPSTLAQRIVRAKTKLREENIPFSVPQEHELAGRLEAVTQIIYLVFNEGYYTSVGETATRIDLSGEAIRLGRLLLDLLPEPEVAGLLALMLLHESRRTARTTTSGDLILLEDQDRSLWDRGKIEEGLSLVRQSFSESRAGPYALQAAIAACHAEAENPEETDWVQITGLYSLLLQIHPSPVIELNRAVAVAMSEGPEAGLNQIDSILDRGELIHYPLAYSARAEFCHKLGRINEAQTSWEQALALTQQDPERRFIERKLRTLEG